MADSGVSQGTGAARGPARGRAAPRAPHRHAARGVLAADSRMGSETAVGKGGSEVA